MHKTNFVLLAFLVFVVACNQKASKKPYLLIPADTPRFTVSQEKDAAFLSGFYATRNNSVSLAVDTTFIITLGNNREIRATLSAVQKSDSSIFWKGYVEGDTMSAVLLTSTQNILSGRIITHGELFRIAFVTEGYYQVAKLDPIKLMDTLNDADIAVGLDNRMADNLLECNDPITAIDVLVVYTPAAEKGAGGVMGMRSLIDQSINLTNLSYQYSGVAQRIKLAHAEQITYTESLNSMTDRNSLQNPSDGIMDGVHTLRALYNADIVVLIVESLQAGVCGQAYIQENINHAFAPFAFAVVKRACSADNLSFAHELGHIMGARHTDDSGVLPFPWAHGHESNGYQTVMSKVPGSIRTTNFSNPAVKWANNNPTGVSAIRENFKVLNASAGVVTGFVCKSP